ncbi:UDP-N-acetylmuramoyl-L-alanyl-D-glutamate--2,6-diaminopimelate ligase [Candidatus Nomurabacteria bacterium]|nr:UDP-N-acetylmuramoyl-L-alanyl-D-glutamate--2,6-diaminopimelate ligase [Candidatus Nomurabacteria bacterium]
MKVLEELLKGVDIFEQTGPSAIEVSAICFDTREEIIPQSVFVAIRGTKVDGHDFIDTAIEKGAIAVVCDEIPENAAKGVTYIKVESTNLSLPIMCHNFYDNPSNILKVVGVTGTNGKTTIATLLYQLFEGSGKKSALLSTVECKIGDKVYPATHTTPDPLRLAKMMNEAVSYGAEYVFMEVSSHALDQGRVEGINFRAAIFTNLTLDHLDYHKTFENYRDAKKILFDNLSRNSVAIINTDDENGQYMVRDTKAKVVTVSNKSTSDYMYKVVDMNMDNMELLVNNNTFSLNLVGQYNATNFVEVLATAKELGLDLEEIKNISSSLSGARGRLEKIVSKSGVYGIVDYAHTPDALSNVLGTILEIKKEDQNIITVVGCGGDRDKTKRPVMAKVAFEKSNYTVFTSDNPRSEDPETIIDDMLSDLPKGSPKYERVTDRREAIKRAVSLAKSGDIVLVAGKGHEEYQEINGVKNHFSDKEEIEKVFGL